MILDDGGDATLLLHLGNRAEQDMSVLDNPSSEEEVCLFNAIKRHLKEDSSWYSKRIREIKGVTEETTTGVHRLYPDASGREAEISSYQRERFRDQIKIR